MDANEDELNISRWLLAEGLNGPAIAALGAVEFLLSLFLNSFIVIQALSHRRDSLKKSSNLLLFVLAMTNLLLVVLYIPFWIIACSSGQWLYGRTDGVRTILCQLHGLTFIVLTFTAIHVLALISLDRFLNIVKPQFHKKYISWKVYLIILAVLWISNILVNLIPYYDPTIAKYGWLSYIGGCCVIYEGSILSISIHAIEAVIPLGLIGVTSVWTFVFTRGFLRKNLKRTQKALNKEQVVEQKLIYSIQIKNLVGIFGSLLLLTGLSWSPFFIILSVGLRIGFESIPAPVFATGLIIFLTSNVTGPIVQIYFRKDLQDTLKKMLSRCSIKWKNTSTVQPAPKRSDTKASNMDEK